MDYKKKSSLDQLKKCPYGLCKGRLITRTNRNTGEKFLGCSNYPACDYTEPLPGGNHEETNHR